MKNKVVMNVLKKVMAGSLVMAVVLTVFPVSAKAESNGSSVTYVQMSMGGYADKDERKAPVRDGYVFAGWYQDNQGATVETGTTGLAWAKFVPAEVLSVKTQANKTAVEEKNLADVGSKQTLRVLSSVDSTRYQEVGFEYTFGAGTEKKKVSSTTVYDKLTVMGSSEANEASASTYFGNSAKCFFAVNFTNIIKDNFTNYIYVQPYWVTLDGTTVYGQASNVFLEDHCADKNYYRASVNLFGGQDVAAGKVVATYNSDKFNVVDVVNGRLFKGEIESNKDTAGTVTIVGNASTVNTHEKASDLLMTVRFTKKSGVTDNLKFTSFTSQFCDWSENEVKDIVVQ